MSTRLSHLVPSHFPGNAPQGDWLELDASLLDEERALLPVFPLALLAPPWRDWVSDTSGSAGVPADYVVQSVLAAVAGLCGAGASVRVTDSWSEPLVLWQVAVGGTSSGKSPALGPVRRLLAALEAEWQATDQAGEGPSQFTVADPSVEAIAKTLSANPRGVVLWRDDPSAWLARLGGADRARWRQAWAAQPLTAGDGARFAVSLLGTIEPHRLEEALAGDHGLAARLLYAWPGRPAYCRLAERKKADDDKALQRLRRIARKTRSPQAPLELVFDRHGVDTLDGFLAGLDAELGRVEGLEAGWLGKGGSTVVRLAGALELLAWSGLAGSGPPGHIGREQVEAAAGLWTGYFRPHARAAFDHAVRPDVDWSTQSAEVERCARRVTRWLRDAGKTEVSREEIRCAALRRTVNAQGADRVLSRLTVLGVVRTLPVAYSPHGGRPARRWQVNPALAANPGNPRGAPV